MSLAIETSRKFGNTLKSTALMITQNRIAIYSRELGARVLRFPSVLREAEESFALDGSRPRSWVAGAFQGAIETIYPTTIPAVDDLNKESASLRKILALSVPAMADTAILLLALYCGEIRGNWALAAGGKVFYNFAAEAAPDALRAVRRLGNRSNTSIL